MQAKFGTTSGATTLDGLLLTIAIYDDPTNGLDPHDAVLVAQIAIVGGGHGRQYRPMADLRPEVAARGAGAGERVTRAASGAPAWVDGKA